MQKSLLALLFSVIFALVLGTSGAFAAESEPDKETLSALENVEKTNAKILKEIEKAVEKSYDLYDVYQKDLARESDEKRQADLTAKYEEDITALISKLDIRTQDITRKGIGKAEKSGLTVEVELVPVQFADRIALIDPIKVIGW
ncbi:hypothetical protein [Planococcus sp. CAU13]|uniref:hypothetical protein n=1 Tax=Planococcus sp. CAU13 TaxID=1541197 RepID=UPI001269CC12|nr:hypothetical protein [Planococcus sp. CAU13]